MKRILLAMMFCSSLFGQTKATISGYTKDPSGAVVTGVAITVSNEQTGAKRSVTSDETGFYQVLNLTSGVYMIDAEASGFKRYRSTGLTLTVDQNLRSDIALDIGQVTESVQVSANTMLVDTRSSEQSATIDDRRIVDLPLSGRNVFSLAKTLPGVLGVSAPDNTDATSSRVGPAMNVNGGRANMNYERFNGTYFNHPSRNTGFSVPPPDAVQEFRIQTSNFAADSGRNPGANITVVSKQGTNQLHGALWEFVRNDHLNARNFFDTQKPKVKKNQYGGAAGGPIKKEKVFLFGTFEMNTDRSQASATGATPPSTAELAGDFSYLNGRKQLLNPFDNTPFPNNQIQRSLFDPASLTVLKFVPTVANAGDRLQALGSAPKDAKLFMIRNDVLLTAKQTLFAHYYLNQNTDVRNGLAYGSDIAGWTGQTQGPRNQNAGINHVYTITPRLINQLTLGFTRSYSLSSPTVTRTPSELGVQGMPQYTDAGSIGFQVSARFNLLSGSRDKFMSNNYQVQDHISLVKGRHTMRFGFEYLDLSFFQAFLGPANFQFNGQRTGGGTSARGDAMADFLLGGYQQVNVGNGVNVNDSGTWFAALFYQDDFKVTRRLTLNVGLRYEIPDPWIAKNDGINTVSADPNARSKKFPNAAPAMLFPGDVPRGLYLPDRNNFAPRFGLAWDIAGNGLTAVRAAYGVFYETYNADTTAQQNPPFAGGNRIFQNGLLRDPFGSIGAVAPPAYIDPNAFTFTYPINGFWGPIGQDHLRSPYIQEWNLNVERQLSRDFALSAGYIGKTGRKLGSLATWNAAVFISGNDAAGRPLSTAANAVQRVPFLPGIYGPAGRYLDTSYTSSFHSFQLELRKRFSRGLQFSSSYVIGKSLDSNSSPNGGVSLVDPTNIRHNMGRSDWDRRQAFVLSEIWTPPIYRGSSPILGRIVGGWTLANITIIQSGPPLTFDSGQNTQLNGTGVNSRANINGNPSRDHSSRQDMLQKFFNTEVFGTPVAGSPGSSGRGILSGPALVNTDLAILKEVKVKEEYRFQLRGEFFNVFNQVNFTRVRTSLANTNFGQIDQAGSGRTAQLGLKFLW
jgi:carboxypeptidase family protein